MSKILNHPFKPLFTRKSDQDVQHKPQTSTNIKPHWFSHITCPNIMT